MFGRYGSFAVGIPMTAAICPRAEKFGGNPQDDFGRDLLCLHLRLA